ncbi:MAG: hypothetical protein ACYSSP_12950, partial [Planctomycetota bacterium]
WTKLVLPTKSARLDKPETRLKNKKPAKTGFSNSGGIICASEDNFIYAFFRLMTVDVVGKLRP